MHYVLVQCLVYQDWIYGQFISLQRDAALIKDPFLTPMVLLVAEPKIQLVNIDQDKKDFLIERMVLRRAILLRPLQRTKGLKVG